MAAGPGVGGDGDGGVGGGGMKRTLPTGYRAAIMGQPITVTEKPTGRPGLVRFELNRTLTGMGHERYASASDAVGDRPPDVLARRLFEHESVKSVHVYSNEVTVELVPWKSAEGLKDAIEGLHIHYLPGVVPSLP
jgi:Scaffold protein Nfu/NifU N terminal